MADPVASPVPTTNEDQILSVSFNQDASCLALGLKTGFNVYNSCPFGKCYADTFGGISIVQMLFCSSLVALVGNGDKPAFSRRKLYMYNTKDRAPICELNFVTAILSVRLNRKRVIVVRENKIHIHDINNMKILHTLDTASNPKGLCALSPDDNSYIAYPSNTTGHVYIYDALSLRHITTIAAHTENLTCLSFNRDGSLLATASEKGTIIRVFEVSSDSKCQRFRRGSQRAKVQCISFSLDSSLLCVSSDTGTIHVFRIDESTYIDTAQKKGFMDSLSDVLEPVRSFANIKLPNPGPSLLCAFSERNNYLIAVTNGTVFHYLSEQGEYKFSNEHHFLCE
mmetsp:Transcript_4687/g.7019  ORF Transcript_4687/g.7019 Transcript_4687/m.7019 type:complete len:339 (-) Transcript_4687:114-1130(-)|eukprot:CAMPEP_0201523726 /NCGR_PEP_ID=MMETSP0161_2-20130828/20889_1 /ASSEMBLY_ACC=CAM_ASM_000251 /TAXON_ID=180227 /ORGANISM="Neoparamoeba aestuarina, Strain SoJaBio B1-5/56/2" /LENGTH=338 /DNA_ID=CAMNT_0047922931 /DNA_START=155 /DNA_END=1171 /DNA_ORIENTATION=-